MKRKSIILLASVLVLALLAAGGAVVYKKQQAGASAKTEDVPAAEPTLVLAAVDIASAGPAVLNDAIPVSGTVDAARQAAVRSRHSGFATGLSKRAGDSVKVGERLGRVDSDELRLRIAERESAVAQAQAQLSLAESTRVQQRSLADRGFISRSALDSVESSYVSARSNYDAAKTQLDIARSALNETVLTAPISGIIAKRAVEPGERISAESIVFNLIDPSSLEVVVPVPAERAAELKVGQTADFQIDSGASGRVITGTLTRIIPTTSSAARTVETRFSLPTDSGVPAGAFLSGQLVLSQSNAALTVPRTSIKQDANGHYLWLIRDNKTARQSVTIAKNDDGVSRLIPLESGVQAGDIVWVLRGLEPKAGQTVMLPSALPAKPDTSVTPTAPAEAGVATPNKP